MMVSGDAAKSFNADFPFDMPDASHSFEERGGWLTRRLAEIFNLQMFQAAGIVGNLGYESIGLKVLQEMAPAVPGSRGGYGWAQWTGPRRRAFEKHALSLGISPASDEANYSFLVFELRGPYRRVVEKLREKELVETAVFLFGHDFEAPGGTTATYLPGYEGRLTYALGAFAGAGGSSGTKPPAPAYTHIDAARDMQAALGKLGLYKARIDGDWGPLSRAAYAEFLKG